MINTIFRTSVYLMFLYLCTTISWSDATSIRRDNVIASDNQMRLEMHADKEIYQPCEQIIISVTASNISDVTINVWSGKSEYSIGFLFGVYNETKNKNTSFTDYGNEVYKPYYDSFSAYPGYTIQVIDGKVINNVPILSPTILTIPPDESISKKFVMNRLYDMSSSGDYVISCSCTLEETKASPSYIFMETMPLKIQVEDKPQTPLIDNIKFFQESVSAPPSAATEIRNVTSNIFDATDCAK